MNAETFLEQFETFAEAPCGVDQLRAMILQLAVQGKLVPQDPNDEPAKQLRARIIQRRNKLVDAGEFTAFNVNTDEATVASPFDLPTGWEWIRLGELGSFLGGGTPSKERPEYWDGEVPWVSPKDMKRPYMHDAIDHVSTLGVENSSGKMIPVGSLLMVVRGMILAHSFPVALAMRELTINQDMKALRLALPEIGEYLLRCCTASKLRMLANVERSSHGTCRLASEAIANFPVPLPPLAEQKRIVAKVDQLLALCDELAARQEARRVARTQLVGATLDRLVSTRSAADLPPHVNRLQTHFDHLFDTPTTIPQLRQTILQLAVQGQLVPQDPNDEPASVSLNRIRGSVGDIIDDDQRRRIERLPLVTSTDGPYALPHEWTWARFPELGQFGRGKSRHRPRNEPKLYSNGTYPLVQTGDVARANGWIETWTGKYNEFGLAQSRLWPKGTMCITIAANIADSGLLAIEACIPDSVVGFIPHPEIGDAAYFEFFMRTAKSRLEDFAPSTAQKNINLGILDSVLIPYPPLAEQKRIVAKVTELLSLCDTLEAQLQTAESASSQLLSAAVHHLLST